MKSGVFKLSWIKQRSLEFNIHEVHSGKKKKEQLLAAINRPHMVVARDTRRRQQRVEVCLSIDNRHSAIDRPLKRSTIVLWLSTCVPIESWLGLVCRHASYGCWQCAYSEQFSSLILSSFLIRIRRFLIFFFFMRFLPIYWRCFTFICNLERWIVLRVLRLVCLREFHGRVRIFSNLYLRITL